MSTVENEKKQLIIGRGRIGKEIGPALRGAELLAHGDLPDKQKFIDSRVINCSLDPRLFERRLTTTELHKSLFLDLAAGANKYVYLSTRRVYSKREQLNATEDSTLDPDSYYGENKLIQETLLQNEIHPDRLLILRLPNLLFVQNGSVAHQYRPQFMEVFLRNLFEFKRVELLGRRETTKDFLLAKDLAYVVRCLLEYECSGIYNVSYGGGITFEHLIQIALRIDPSISLMMNDGKAADSFYLNSRKINGVVELIKDQVQVVETYLRATRRVPQ